MGEVQRSTERDLRASAVANQRDWSGAASKVALVVEYSGKLLLDPLVVDGTVARIHRHEDLRQIAPVDQPGNETRAGFTDMRKPSPEPRRAPVFGERVVAHREREQAGQDDAGVKSTLEEVHE